MFIKHHLTSERGTSLAGQQGKQASQVSGTQQCMYGAQSHSGTDWGSFAGEATLILGFFLLLTCFLTTENSNSSQLYHLLNPVCTKQRQAVIIHVNKLTWSPPLRTVHKWRGTEPPGTEVSRLTPPRSVAISQKV